MTDFAFFSMSRSSCSVSGLEHAKAKEVPSIATKSAPSVVNYFPDSSFYSRSSNDVSFSVSLTDIFSISLHALAIVFVVSILSPVKIQT